MDLSFHLHPLSAYDARHGVAGEAALPPAALHDASPAAPGAFVGGESPLAPACGAFNHAMAVRLAGWRQG